MRQNLTIALLAVCATLLVVQLVVVLHEPTPSVHGQAAGGGGTAQNYLLVSGVGTGGNEPILYIFDAAAKKLTAYSTTASNGIAIKGTRTLVHDFEPDWFVAPGGKALSPDDVKKALEKSKK
jgi:hypothetical protein